MGIAVSAAKRAIRNWNSTNRALRHFDKVEAKRKVVPSSSKFGKSSCQYEEALAEKDAGLEERVASFDIANEGVKSSILPEGFNYVPKSSRKLPQRLEFGSPIPPPHLVFGFAVPEFIPEGKITMRQAVDMIRSYQLEEKTVFQLADDYDLDKSMVASVCRYFALFERDVSDVWVPPRGSKDMKTLLDTPIYEDEQIADEGTSRRLRLHVPKFTSDQ